MLDLLKNNMNNKDEGIIEYICWSLFNIIRYNDFQLFYLIDNDFTSAFLKIFDNFNNEIKIPGSLLLTILLTKTNEIIKVHSIILFSLIFKK